MIEVSEFEPNQKYYLTYFSPTLDYQTHFFRNHLGKTKN